MMNPKLVVAPLAAAAIFLSACAFDHGEKGGPVETLKRTIELDKSEAVRVRLKMGAGQMEVRGGSPNLMDAEFKYNIPSWKPEVHYEGGTSNSSLEILQPGGEHSIVGNHEYDWDVRLNDAKPMSLDVQFGAGECTMNAGSLNLQNLEVKMGVGKLTLDLRGTPKKEYSVRIRGGVGEANVYVPSTVGVVAFASGGIGDVDGKGLHKRGDRWVNDAYENNAKVSIRLDISGGIGAIHLIGS